MNTKRNYFEVNNILNAIYQKHRKKQWKNPDSKQMCCMWSTDDPPDVLEDTEPLLDMEKAFDICIDEDSAIEMYEMTLDQATKRIMELMHCSLEKVKSE
jgi:hypothetical protein